MTADQPEAQPETAAPVGPATVYDRLFGAILMTRDDDLLELARSAGDQRLIDLAAARAAGFREGAAEGAARWREAPKLDDLIAAIHDATPVEEDGGVPDVCNRWHDHEWIARRVLELLAGPEAREPGISAERLAMALYLTSTPRRDERDSDYVATCDKVAERLVAEYLRLATEPTAAPETGE